MRFSCSLLFYDLRKVEDVNGEREGDSDRTETADGDGRKKFRFI